MNKRIEKFRQGGVIAGPSGSLLTARHGRNGNGGPYNPMEDGDGTKHTRIFEEYRDAGAHFGVANTYKGNPYRAEGPATVQPTGEWTSDHDRFYEQQVALVREVWGENACTLGSVASLLDSSGKHDAIWAGMTFSEQREFALNGHVRNIRALLSRNGAVDIPLAEALRYPVEAAAIAQVAQDEGAEAVALSFEVNHLGFPYPEPNLGITSFTDLRAYLDAQFPYIEIFLLGNCSGVTRLTEVLEGDSLDGVYANRLNIKDQKQYLAWMESNHGNGEAVPPGCELTSDLEFGVFAREALDHGVNKMGSCCGTTPDTTRAMRDAVDAWYLEQL